MSTLTPESIQDLASNAVQASIDAHGYAVEAGMAYDFMVQNIAEIEPDAPDLPDAMPAEFEKAYWFRAYVNAVKHHGVLVMCAPRAIHWPCGCIFSRPDGLTLVLRSTCITHGDGEI